MVPGDPVLSLLLPVALVYAAVRSDDPQLQGGEREEAENRFAGMMSSDASAAQARGCDGTSPRCTATAPVCAPWRLPQDVRTYATRDREVLWWFADCLAYIGDTEEALHWLANSVERGFLNAAFFSDVDPFVASLRSDPRFVTLMSSARERALEV